MLINTSERELPFFIPKIRLQMYNLTTYIAQLSQNMNIKVINGRLKRRTLNIQINPIKSLMKQRRRTVCQRTGLNKCKQPTTRSPSSNPHSLAHNPHLRFWPSFHAFVFFCSHFDALVHQKKTKLQIECLLLFTKQITTI